MAWAWGAVRRGGAGGMLPDAVASAACTAAVASGRARRSDATARSGAPTTLAERIEKMMAIAERDLENLQTKNRDSLSSLFGRVQEKYKAALEVPADGEAAAA